MAIQDSKEYGILHSAKTEAEQAVSECTNKDYLPQKNRLWVWATADLADLHLKKGTPADALALYIQAIKIDPDEPSVLNQIGVCLIQLGKIDRALYYFDLLERRASAEIELELLKPSPNPKVIENAEENKGLGLFNQAMCHKLSSNYNEAIILLRKSLRCQNDELTVAELDNLKEMTSREAYAHFRHNLFSKNVLPESKQRKSNMEVESENYKMIRTR